MLAQWENKWRNKHITYASRWVNALKWEQSITNSIIDSGLWKSFLRMLLLCFWLFSFLQSATSIHCPLSSPFPTSLICWFSHCPSGISWLQLDRYHMYHRPSQPGPSSPLSTILPSEPLSQGKMQLLLVLFFFNPLCGQCLSISQRPVHGQLHCKELSDLPLLADFFY